MQATLYLPLTAGPLENFPLVSRVVFVVAMASNSEDEGIAEPEIKSGATSDDSKSTTSSGIVTDCGSNGGGAEGGEEEEEEDYVWTMSEELRELAERELRETEQVRFRKAKKGALSKVKTNW